MKSNRLLSLLLIFCASMVARSQSSPGQTNPAPHSPEAIVFFDFRGANPTSRVITNSHEKFWIKIHDAINKRSKRTLGEESGVDVYTLSTSDSKLVDFFKLLDEKVGEPPLRVITEKGQVIEVFALVPPNKTVDLDAKEESRDTVLTEGLRILKGHLKGNLDIEAVDGGTNLFLLHKSFTLDMVRANLLVTAKQPAVEDPTTVVTKAEVPLVTGPAEHFYLGATINLENVKYSDGSVKPSEKPNHLHVGLYYQPFGDILTNYDGWSNKPWEPFSKLVVVHISVEVSNKPFGSRSCGVGIKSPKLSGNLKFLSGLSITRGFMRTEGERIVGSTTEKFHQSDWVWMVGYDLLQVKDWFTK